MLPSAFCSANTCLRVFLDMRGSLTFRQTRRMGFWRSLLFGVWMRSRLGFLVCFLISILPDTTQLEGRWTGEDVLTLPLALS